jgi:hypothetical protein
MSVRVTAGALALALTAACGEPDLEPPDVSDPGQGTGGLLVQAHVKGEAVAPNARDASGYRTRYEVVVRWNGFAVIDAAVRVNDLVLVHRGGGLYTEPAQQLGLPPPVVALAVTARDHSHWLAGARSSPGHHAFLRPAGAGEVLATGPATPLDIRWERARRADDASLDVAGFAAVGDIDDGRFVVPGGAPGLREGAAARCGLWRENRVLLRGGATGSALSVSVWNGLTFTLRRG